MSCRRLSRVWEVASCLQASDFVLSRLIPFALIIIIAEEVIPLVVMYAPFILPSTCILPSQKERIDTKRRAKQAAYPQTMRDVFEVIRQRAKENPSADMHTLLDSQGLVAISG